MRGGKGKASLTSDAGDGIVGTAGDDVIVGTADNETFHGMGGNDYINGGYGSDTLYGDDGNDVLWGYHQWGVSDTLYGGAGSDTFLFVHPGESLDQAGKRDVIGDFETADKIDLSSSYFSGVTWNDISVEQVSGDHYIVHVNVDGDTADMGIDVVGAMPTQDNFVLWG